MFNLLTLSVNKFNKVLLLVRNGSLDKLKLGGFITLENILTLIYSVLTSYVKYNKKLTVYYPCITTKLYILRVTRPVPVIV